MNLDSFRSTTGHEQFQCSTEIWIVKRDIRQKELMGSSDNG